jgi:N-acetylglucosamine-6-phosphate deacetylase
MIKFDMPLKRPGLVDLQVNGFCGVDFNGLSLEKRDVERVCRLLKTEGVVGFLPTLVTNDPTAIESLASTILDADDSSGAKILGLHLEGPFISVQEGARGAHALQWIRPPDIDWIRHIHDRTDGRIRLLTCSPEWSGSAAFIEAVCRLGIRVAIGHTMASDEHIREAVCAGATLSTHLGNGIPATLPRYPNPIWSQLSEDRLWASVIGDGFHLPREVFSTILKIKGDKALLVSDSTQFAGMEPGRYRTLIGGNVMLTETAKLYMCEDERLLAGSAMSLRQEVETLVFSGWMDMKSAWELASIRPWQFLGETAPLPTIEISTTWKATHLETLSPYA